MSELVGLLVIFRCREILRSWVAEARSLTYCSASLQSARKIMKHTVPHDLGLEQAKKVAQAALDAYSAKFPEYSPETKWVSDTKVQLSFKVKGVSLSGGVEVSATTIDLELNVPFLLKPFQGKAVEVIEREIQKWIGKAKEGKL